MSATKPQWDYKDDEQVAPFMPEFLRIHAEIIAAGGYPYNDSFKGRIPGVAGTSTEDSAIYQMQGSKARAELAEQVAAALADGFEPIDRADVVDGSTTKYATIVRYGWYMGDTGWAEWHDARLTTYHGCLAVLPKGKRTRGHLIDGGKVMVKR